MKFVNPCVAAMKDLFHLSDINHDGKYRFLTGPYAGERVDFEEYLIENDEYDQI